MRSYKMVAIIQARMSSSRLPGKVLLDILGKPMLQRVFERVQRATSLDQVVVATTTDASDDPIAAFCREHQYPFYRGSLHDVLDRFYQAARVFQADGVVRITADCPVIDPQLIDETVAAFWGRSDWRELIRQDESVAPAYDFAANRLPPPWKRTYPIGLDVEVCSFSGLERAWREATEPYQREHVMPYFYDQEGRFRCKVLDWKENYGNMRWTVDTPQDLELIRRIYAYFQGRDDFSWLEILDLMQKDASLAEINAGTHHKNLFEAEQGNAPQGNIERG